MWETYRSVSKLMFPNSKGILDKFHVVAELRRNTDAVRLRIQNDNYRTREQPEKNKRSLKRKKPILHHKKKKNL